MGLLQVKPVPHILEDSICVGVLKTSQVQEYTVSLSDIQLEIQNLCLSAYLIQV